MNRLFVNKLTSIGAVEDGDNPGANIMLFKRRVKKENLTERVDQVRAAWGKDNPYRDGLANPYVEAVHDEFVIIEDGENKFRVPYTITDTDISFGAREQVTITETITTVKAADSDTSKGPDMDLEKLGLTPEAIEAVNAEFEKLRTPPKDVDVLKGADDAVKAEFAKQQTELETLRKSADAQKAAFEKERDARLDAEFAKTAESYPILGEDAGPMLKALSSDDTAYKWLIEKFDALSAIAAASDVFKELGVTDETDATSQIESLAVEKRKDNTDLTMAQAKTLVRKERPDLRDKEREAK